MAKRPNDAGRIRHEDVKKQASGHQEGEAVLEGVYERQGPGNEGFRCEDASFVRST